MDINSMTLSQKIGQMMMVGFPSDQIDGHFKEIVGRYKAGNIILFTRNLKKKRDIANLNREIQAFMMEHIGIPALISTDQEGGMVTRLPGEATFLSGHMAIAATTDPENAYRIGQIAGRELRALGINMNLAPVLDVNNNSANPVIGVRSFGEDPQWVAEYGTKFLQGLQQAGIITTAKHFPGHGDTMVDSHLDLPCIPHPLERLETVEFLPFQAAIRAGVDAIMSAHILFPALEPQKVPATLSKNILTGLLREKMGFGGVVITDCLEMQAIATYFGTAQGAMRAIKAGADLVCVSHTLELQIETAEEIRKAVISGEIPEARIDEAVARILALKERYGILNNPYPDEQAVARVVGCDEHINLAESISTKSITVVKNTENLVPVRESDVFVISPEPASLTIVEDESKRQTLFTEVVARGLGGIGASIPLDPTEEVIEELVNRAKKHALIIIGTYNANLYLGQQELVTRLGEQGKVVAVSLRNPYDLETFPEITAYLCAYEYTPLSVKSLLKVLKGEVPGQGKLPITLRIVETEG